PLLARSGAPAGESLLSCARRGVDVLSIARDHFVQHAPVHRADVVEQVAARAALGPATDEMAERCSAPACQACVRLLQIALECGAHFAPTARRFTYSCRLFLLKVSTGSISCISSESPNG